MDVRHHFILELFNGGGTRVGQESLTVDWEPAAEWARLRAVRRGELPPSGSRACGSVEPLWHPQFGRPYTSGFRVGLELDGREAGSEFGSIYFADRAREASARLVAAGKLVDGETFKYVVAAFPAEPSAGGSPDGAFAAVDASPDFPVEDGSLAELLDLATPEGEPEAADLPLFVPRRVLDEAAKLAGDAEASETGGVLIGHLRRDPTVPGARDSAPLPSPCRPSGSAPIMENRERKSNCGDLRGTSPPPPRVRTHPCATLLELPDVQRHPGLLPGGEDVSGRAIRLVSSGI